MTIVINDKIQKYLQRRYKGDKKGVMAIQAFLELLEQNQNPTALKNAKKMQGNYQKYGNIWRWRIGNYRIIGDVKNEILEIQLIEISTRQDAY